MPIGGIHVMGLRTRFRTFERDDLQRRSDPRPSCVAHFVGRRAVILYVVAVHECSLDPVNLKQRPCYLGTARA
jgi:hypothetical protein